MIARWLAREFRDFPVTTAFCLAWIVVFLAMSYLHMATGAPLPASRWLGQGFGGGEPFGDLTLTDLSRGEIWRLITCNFVHYSVVHLGLNLLAMYQLGSLLESWYGPYQLVFVYGLTGGLGNLISATARFWMKAGREVHSGGGSVAIMGMVGVCAVAGWRSGHAEGRRLGSLMLIFIALTAALGATFPRHIDNWGHAGGLLVGLAIGLAHRRLRDRVGKPEAWGAGVLTGLVILASAGAQYVAERREGPARMERLLARRSNYLTRAKEELGWLRRPDAPPAHLDAASKWLDVLEEMLADPARAEIQLLRPLVKAARVRPLEAGERRDCDQHLARLLGLMSRRYAEDRRQLRRLKKAP